MIYMVEMFLTTAPRDQGLEKIMLISQKKALGLIKDGKAGNKSFVWPAGVNHELTQPQHVAIDRFDLQRVDHYPPTKQDLQNWIDGKDASGNTANA